MNPILPGTAGDGTAETGVERVRGDGAGRGPVAGCLFGAGVVVAPFLASLYGLNVGLAVMTLALATTTWFGASTARTAAPAVRRRLLPIVFVNGVLAVACLATLLMRLLA